MTRIQTLLKAIRYALSDVAVERWTDERLLLLISEAHADIAVRTMLLKGTFNLYPCIGKAEYDLPADCWMPIRARYGSRKLEVLSHDEMDAETLLPTTAASWELDEGAEPLALIKDNRNMLKIRLYPIPNEDSQTDQFEFTAGAVLDKVVYDLGVYGEIATAAPFDSIATNFGVVTSADGLYYTNDTTTAETPVGVSSPYGISTEIVEQIEELTYYAEDFGTDSSLSDFDQSGDFGVLSSIEDIAAEYEANSVFGVVTELYDVEDAVVVQYVKTPEAISTIDDELLTHPMYDIAIQHFVTGRAYQDDHDAKSTEKANSAFTWYNSYIEEARSTSAKDSVNTTIRPSAFRTGFQ